MLKPIDNDIVVLVYGRDLQSARLFVWSVSLILLLFHRYVDNNAIATSTMPSVEEMNRAIPDIPRVYSRLLVFCDF